ncbi:hypothetical protein H2200_007271 [Cladophialophora chaetospira]|uniref:HhH-GPD domain-containing protein n=1 Tax=Cladophialophora chaetospira TaxID=386627 RepID=A0AA38X7N2_9EURO|nr:hypothetical protein H2200_007271 [Cladophialophora chaetospira]
MVFTRSQVARERAEIEIACAATTISCVLATAEQPASSNADIRPSTPNFELDMEMVDPAAPIFDSDDAMSDFPDDENEAEKPASSSLPRQSGSLIIKLKVSLSKGFESASSSAAAQVDSTGCESSGSTTRPTSGIKRELPVRNKAKSPIKRTKKSNEGEDGDFAEPVSETMTDTATGSSRQLRTRGADGKVANSAKVVHSEDTTSIVLKAEVDIDEDTTVQADITIIKKRKILRPRRKIPYTNKYNFEFGEDRLAHFAAPLAKDIEEVVSRLLKERPTLLKVVAEAGAAATPFHAGLDITIDSIVRVIIAQACTNELALDAQQTMIRAYPYTINGKHIWGKMPNYHLMRLQSRAKLEKVLKPAGLQVLKSGKIKELLDVVYAKNVELLGPGANTPTVNEPGATDFVPGMLSLQYIQDAYIQKGKQAVFDELVKLPLIGVKSACCLMGFNMGLPVFAVDTHVMGMAKLLG